MQSRPIGHRPIRQLDADTIAQIAAGEVIERPVSVVKELVENSLDASAGAIVVEVVDGGRTAISVSDDGGGISRDQLALAFARHATSKLAAPDDLFAVATLGFRGEGLASIAAAGATTLVSRPRAAELGARIEARGSEIGSAVACAAPPGTKVVVRDLFHLTPARREFMKSARAEFARISAFLSRIALGWPHVSFTLRHNGNDVWSLPAVTDAIERLEMVFGSGARGALIAIDANGPAAVGVAGYVSKPGRDRPNRDGQVFFVNGRLVRSGALGAAWLAGSGSFGMTGRFPFGAIALTLPSHDVDVNVHPTKIEVRFARGNEVFDALRIAVARTLRATGPARTVPDIAFAPAGAAASLNLSDSTAPAPNVADMLPIGHDRDRVAARVYGQIDQTYIVIGDDAGLLLIDQHAAHERIAYEALLDRAGTDDVESPLLIPTVVELTADQAAVLHEYEAELTQAGVIVEPFGDGAYRVCALPAAMQRRRFDLAAILEDLHADDAAREGAAHHNRVIATIACHSVVRAHEPLALQEQASLYERLLRCRDPHTCPHGRPTMVRVDARSLAKAFGRA